MVIVSMITGTVIRCAGLCPECTIVPVDPPAPHRWRKGNNHDFCSRFFCRIRLHHWQKILVTLAEGAIKKKKRKKCEFFMLYAL
jgi:hypothetical protein